MQDIKTLKLTPNASKASPTSEGSPDRASFVCPLTLKEMNGSQPFVFLWTCGCVFSQAGLRAVADSPPPREDLGVLEKEKSEKTKSPKSESEKNDSPVAEPPKTDELDLCPQCGAKYNRSEDVLTLNPSPKEESKMFDAIQKSLRPAFG